MQEDFIDKPHAPSASAAPASHPTRRAVLGGLSGLALAPAAGLAQSPTPWPSQPVTIVVPTATAGVTDIVARILSVELGAMWNSRSLSTTKPAPAA